jgi:2-hydroxy-3-oxopropionate reductase
MRRVGIVGLGFMGRGLAANLAKGLNRLNVYDISKENCSLFQKSLCQEKLQRVTFTKSIEHLAEESDVICLSLPNDLSCREVLFGSRGVAQTWQTFPNEQRLIIDHSTTSKDFAQQISRELQQQNPLFDYMDCPVSGGPVGAQNATLTLMVGGSTENFRDNLALFHMIGKKIVYLGPTGRLAIETLTYSEIGSGMAGKLVNNALVTAHAQCAAEAILMAERLGLLEGSDHSMERIQNFFEMLQSSWGQSKVLELIGDDYVTSKLQMKQAKENDVLRDFPTQAPLRNLKKDMICVIHDLQQNSSSNSQAVRQSFPLFHTASDCLERACSSKYDLADSPFAALLIPIREDSKS